MSTPQYVRLLHSMFRLLHNMLEIARADRRGTCEGPKVDNRHKLHVQVST